jgi:hypothetical protein
MEMILRASALLAVRAQPAARLDALVRDGILFDGPAPFLELQEGSGSDERSDRSRAFPPHVADVLYTARFHASVENEFWAAEASKLKADTGLSVEWIELVVIADDADAERLEGVVANQRPEISTAVVVLHFVGPDARAVRALTSRAEQRKFEAVREFLRPLGTFRAERLGDLMDTSELPFVITVAVDEKDSGRAIGAGSRLLGRDGDTAPFRLSDLQGWHVRVWPDAAVVAASADERPRYRLAKRTPNVALSVVLDGFVLRFAQRQILEMLARRVASGGKVTSGSLGGMLTSAVRLRARVWWERLSLERFVDEPAAIVSQAWGLPELAREVFDEAGALAEQARLAANERIAKILFLLTVASVAVAVAALTVQVATSNHLSAAVMAALVPAVVTLLTGCVLYGLFFSPRLLKPRGE